MPTCRAGRGLPCARLEVKTHSDMMGVHARAQECTDAGGGGGTRGLCWESGDTVLHPPQFPVVEGHRQPLPQICTFSPGGGGGGATCLFWHLLKESLFCAKSQHTSSNDQIELFLPNSMNWLGNHTG